MQEICASYITNIIPAEGYSRYGYDNNTWFTWFKLQIQLSALLGRTVSAFFWIFQQRYLPQCSKSNVSFLYL